LEAAQEIARQLRLRNLNGIIIIDLINMEEEESRTALARTLKAALREDPVQATFVGFTRLSLVELTRKKKERTLAELVQK
jgi:ribonuclease G